MKELKILSPTAILGYGFPEESFRAAIAQKPDLIAVDAGSTDPGPYYLGSGTSFTSTKAVKRDLTFMVKAACELGVPLVVGTAGGSGSAPHLDRDMQIIKEIANENKLSFKLATISADLDKEFLKGELKLGHIEPLGPVTQAIEKDIDDSIYVVAQMGSESIIRALDADAQIILCGRCYDPAVFAAPAIRLGYDVGLATHLGKVLECAAISSVPGSGADCMMGYLGKDYFEVEPMSPKRKCTATSVSAHTLYEKSNPYMLPGPGGMLDLSGCTFTQVTDRRVRVTGSKYIKAEKNTVKLEGARLAGYRTISICGNHDPIFISQVDEILEDLRKQVVINLSGQDLDYKLNFIVYGKNGVMGRLESSTVIPYEVGIVIDAVADSQKTADVVCATARSTLLHYGYNGRIATAGNLAFPFSPSDSKMGAVYTFSLYHLLEIDCPEKLFPCTYYTVEEGKLK